MAFARFSVAPRLILVVDIDRLREHCFTHEVHMHNGCWKVLVFCYAYQALQTLTAHSLSTLDDTLL